jgi:hypothetical protein
VRAKLRNKGKVTKFSALSFYNTGVHFYKKIYKQCKDLQKDKKIALFIEETGDSSILILQ